MVYIDTARINNAIFFIFVMDIFLFQWTKVLLKHPVQTAIQKIIC